MVPPILNKQTLEKFIIMSDILSRRTVLVLNRAWQPINTQVVSEAILQMSTDVATALDIDEGSMSPVKWDDWVRLPIRDQDAVIHTPNLRIRVPTVIVCANYSQVPKKAPKFSNRGIYERDGGTCQYTGRKLAHGEANIDHVLPRSRGGKSNWDNCVLADKRVNSQKGSKTPIEAGMTLIRKPRAPKALPVSMLIKNLNDLPDWDHFLITP